MKNKTASTEYSRTYDLAAQAFIEEVLLPLGRTEVHLHADLYGPLRAYTPAQQCGVRWAVRRAKEKGLLAKTKVRGVYTVI
jgi:hypothetical protein